MRTILVLVVFLGILFTSCEKGPRQVEIQTEFGNMRFELYDDTPQHRDNFVKLIQENYYKDLLFHRIIQGFMIQGGDPDSKDAPIDARLGGGGPSYRVPAEIKHKHIKGALAAARDGNKEKASSGSQFYVVQGRKMNKPSIEQLGTSKGIKYTEEEIQAYVSKGGTPMLDGDYTVFGKMISGEEVLDKIAAVPKNNADRPLENVKMDIKIIR